MVERSTVDATAAAESVYAKTGLDVVAVSKGKNDRLGGAQSEWTSGII